MNGGLLSHLAQRVLEPPALRPLLPDPFAGPSLREREALTRHGASDAASDLARPPSGRRASERDVATAVPAAQRVRASESPASAQGDQQVRRSDVLDAEALDTERAVELRPSAGLQPRLQSSAAMAASPDVQASTPLAARATAAPLASPPVPPPRVERDEPAAGRAEPAPRAVAAHQPLPEHAAAARLHAPGALLALAARLDLLQRELAGFARATRAVRFELPAAASSGEPTAHDAARSEPVRAPLPASSAVPPSPSSSARAPQVASALSPAPARDASGAAAERVRATPLLAAALRAPLSHAPLALEQAPAQAVHITIGRVEIRASAASPAAAPRTANRERAGLSLSRYLEQRGARR